MPGFELFGADERKEVNDVLETGILMRYGFDAARKGIWKSLELENAIKERFQTPHAQLVSSGTAALTTAMAALGIGYGDEIIMPAFTFVASFEAVVSVGAIPVLVDIDNSLTLDPIAVKNAITPKTKAIMPVHMCGSMADLDALQAICKEHNILLLEDACQAIGGTYKGKPLGSIGDAGTFSFDFVKTMTCGEGGVVMTKHADVYTKADQYSDHGHDHAGKDRGADLHPFVGYNFRISELHAAVGLAQIKRLDSFLALQQRNHQIIKEALQTIPEISFRVVPDEQGDSCSFISFFLPNEALTQKVVAAFAAQGIAGNFYWYSNNWHYISKWDHLKNAAFMNHLHPDHKAQIIHHATKSFAQSDAIMSRCISSAISIGWTEDQVKERASAMANAIKSVLQSN